MAIKEYFPGANTPDGFYSYYPDIFKGGEGESIVVLKGGPGTGKSTLMKKTAAHAEHLGYTIELLHCSSDPDSLDGVCIREKGFLIVDGTAPHVIDPVFPGAIGEIINLGDCWRADEIRVFKNEIKKLSEDISHEFQKAYSYMKAAYSIMNQIKCDFGFNRDCILQELDLVKTELGINMLCPGGEKRRGFLSADTHLGRISYANSFAKDARYIITVIPDIGGAWAEYMRNLAMMLTNSGLSVRIFYSSMNPESDIEHIYVENESIFITTEKLAPGNQKVVDFSAYNKTPCPLQYESDMQLYNSLMQKTTNALKNAKKLHDELEKYYIPHMNFDMTDSALDYILRKLK